MARIACAALAGLAAAVTPIGDDDGAGSLLGSAEAQRLLYGAIAQLDCRILYPRDADAANLPWCMHPGQARATTRAQAEARAIADGLARLREAGFADVLRGGTIVHFAASAEEFESDFASRVPNPGRAEFVHAMDAAEDIGHSYYLHEQGLIALRPSYWEREVMRQMRVQFGARRVAGLDPVAFPAQVSLYHEFGHRVLDHESGDIVTGNRAEAAADLFAAIMIARQHGLDFARVARAFVKARQVREEVEDDVHRNANLLLASLWRLEPTGAGPAPSFASVRRIVFALADSAIASAQAALPGLGGCEAADPPESAPPAGAPEVPVADPPPAGAPKEGC